MDTSVYLVLRENKTFHTIIIKKKVNDYTYVSAVGYAGGQVYGDFYGKFSKGPRESNYFTGLYSWSNGSGLWDNKLTSLKFNNESKRFDTEIDDFHEFMDKEDEKIQLDLLDELSKYIKYGYDEETDTEYEYPESKTIDESIFSEFEDSPGQYCNENWGDEWLKITCSSIWGLSFSFPNVINNYL